MEKYVPDAETCIALAEIGVDQGKSLFAWVDTGVLDTNRKPVFKLLFAEGLDRMRVGTFDAPTAQELQTLLPINFVPIRFGDGQWAIVDFYGTAMKDVPASGVAAAGKSVVLARVNGSNANGPAQAFAQAAIFLVKEGALKL